MKYLFFDIEAANRHDCVAKIYSFGYVVADENLKVLEEGEVIINPKADFYFTVNKEHVRINCPIDLCLVNQAGEFPSYHEKLRKLLSNKICIGYGALNDAYMLHESCKRYNLDSFRFNYYELYEIADIFTKKRIKGLVELAKQLEITNKTPHNGHADAYTTYMIYKKLKLVYKFNMNSLIKKSKIYRYTVKKYKVYKEAKENSRLIRKKVFPDMRIKEEEITSGKLKYRFIEELVI